MPSSLAVQRFAIDLTFPKGARLPAYAGSTLRGSLVAAFKAAVCSQRSGRCDGCLLARSCPYSLLFETPADLVAGLMSRYEKAPHPYLIEPPSTQNETRFLEYAPNASLRFHLVLCGRALSQLPYFIHALERMADRGLGRDRHPARLERVSVDGRTIYQPGGLLHEVVPVLPAAKATESANVASLTVRFQTPTRIIFQGKPLLGQFPFRGFMGALLRRLGLMAAYHGQGAPDIDYPALLRQAEQICCETAELRFHDWFRWSNRQQRKIPMGGAVGRIVWSGELAPFLPYIRLGEWLHVGKGAVMGMGHYTVEETA